MIIIADTEMEPPESSGGGGGAAAARPARAMYQHVCEDRSENIICLVTADTRKVMIARGARLRAVAAAPQWRQAPARSSDHTDDSLCMLHTCV